MNVWEYLYSKHVSGSSVMLLYVVKSEGSSPGRRGFAMAVAADRSFYGSIGGGIMEHKLVERARAKLSEEHVANLIEQVHDKSVEKNQSGMICSGRQLIFEYKLQEKDISQIEALVASLQDHKNGTLQLSNEGIVFLPAVPLLNYCFEGSHDHFIYKEKTGFKNVLHIVGGGHCSLALSKIMSDMDFLICVYDDRTELTTMHLKAFAHKQFIVNTYSELSDLIEAGDNAYVVIMTMGYRFDDMAVRALYGKHFKYLGVLGSKNKIDRLAATYANENLDSAAFANIRWPIGVQIKSETAEEIAVSIAAEIISVKNSI